MTSEQRSAIHPVGPFDLARSITFLEEWPVTSGQAERDSALRFAFCLENDWRPVGVRVTQHGDRVDVEASGPGAAAETVVAQVARVLSLDVDATVVDEIAERDPVVARLETLVQRVAGGHRSPIVPVVIGDEHEAVKAAAALLERGLLVPAIRPPSVALGTSRLRVTLSAAHTDHQVGALLAGIEEVVGRAGENSGGNRA